jgi:hypothetical protein
VGAISLRTAGARNSDADAQRLRAFAVTCGPQRQEFAARPILFKAVKGGDKVDAKTLAWQT